VDPTQRPDGQDLKSEGIHAAGAANRREGVAPVENRKSEWFRGSKKRKNTPGYEGGNREVGGRRLRSSLKMCTPSVVRVRSKTQKKKRKRGGQTSWFKRRGTARDGHVKGLKEEREYP